MNKVSYIFCLWFFCLGSPMVYGQVAQKDSVTEIKKEYCIYFKQDIHEVDSSYLGNKTNIDSMLAYINELTIRPDSNYKITISSGTSPEGPYRRNVYLARMRMKRILDFLAPYNGVISQITVEPEDNGWRLLREILEQSDKPYKDEVIALIDTVPTTRYNAQHQVVQERKLCVKALQNGAVWNDMYADYFPVLRNSCLVSIERIYVPKAVVPPVDEEPTAVVVPVVPAPQWREIRDRKLVLGIKTNLLYDIVAIPNIGVEVPIGNRFSVGGDWIFPWFSKRSAKWTWQILGGDGEVKYWFGERTEASRLSGWNVGVYGGGAKTDMQPFRKKGKQSNVFSVGVIGGFSHALSDRFNLEYGIGAGYIDNKYRKYYQEDNTEYGKIKVYRNECKRERKHSFNLTKVQVSLVWKIYRSTYKKIAL